MIDDKHDERRSQMLPVNPGVSPGLTTPSVMSMLPFLPVTVRTISLCCRILRSSMRTWPAPPPPMMSARFLFHPWGVRGSDTCLTPHTLNDWTGLELAVESIMVCTRRALDRQNPVIPVLAHDGLEVAGVPKIPGVFARSAMQDSEDPRRIGILPVGDGSEQRWLVVLHRCVGHEDCQLPNFGLSREVFDGRGVLKDELKGTAAHAEQEKGEKPGTSIMSVFTISRGLLD